jgi:hypothetical protein
MRTARECRGNGGAPALVGDDASWPGRDRGIVCLRRVARGSRACHWHDEKAFGGN